MPKLKIRIDGFEITSVAMDLDHLEEGGLNHIDLEGHELIHWQNTSLEEEQDALEEKEEELG